MGLKQNEKISIIKNIFNTEHVKEASDLYAKGINSYKFEEKVNKCKKLYKISLIVNLDIYKKIYKINNKTYDFIFKLFLDEDITNLNKEGRLPIIEVNTTDEKLKKEALNFLDFPYVAACRHIYVEGMKAEDTIDADSSVVEFYDHITDSLIKEYCDNNNISEDDFFDLTMNKYDYNEDIIPDNNEKGHCSYRDDPFQLNSTWLAKEMGYSWSGQVMNQWLCILNFMQYKSYGMKVDPEYNVFDLSWIPTEKGKKYCRVRYGAFNTPMLCWSEDVIPLFKEEYERYLIEEERKKKERTEIIVKQINEEFEKNNVKIKLKPEDVVETHNESNVSYRYEILKKIYSETLYVYAYNNEYGRIRTIRGKKPKFEDLIPDT